MTIYAVGDIHGQLEALKAAHARIEADRAREGTVDANVIFVGDYNDRGPDTKGVLDWLIAGLDAGEPFICLAGNHDRMMLGFADPGFSLDPKTAQFDWLADNLGGLSTLESYGVEPSLWTSRKKLRAAAADAVPQRHLDFLSDLPVMHREGEAVFVHAGLDPDRPLDDQRQEDLFWIRQPFLNHAFTTGPLVVHGHTPVRDVEWIGQRLNVDTGAGFGRPLSAVAIEGDQVFLLTDQGRQKILRQPAI